MHVTQESRRIIMSHLCFFRFFIVI